MTMTRGKEFIVGLTALGGLVGLAIMLLMFGEFAGARVKRYPVILVVPDAAGLTDSSRILLNGVRVGIVSSTTTLPDPRDGVRVEMRINEGVRIPRDVRVSVTQTFVGDTTLTLTAKPSGGPDPGYFQPGDTFSTTAGGMMDQIAGMLESRLGGLGDAISTFRSLGDTYGRVGERLEDFLEPRSMEDVQAGRAEPNLATAMRRFDDALSSAQVWLSDEQLRADVRAAASRATDVIDRAGEAVETWTETARSLSRNADKVGERLDDTTGELIQASKTLNETLIEVQAIAVQVRRGSGTLGQLLNNPDLYNSLNDAAIRLEKALTEAQLLLEKYRKEGIPIQF